MKKTWLPFVALMLIFSMVLSACGATTPEPLQEPTGVMEEPTEAMEEPAPTEAMEQPAPTEVMEEPTEEPVPLETKEEIIVADALPAVTLDPHKEGFSQADTQIIEAVHDKLVAWKDGVEGSEIAPSLATDWSVSEDGLVWTFHLREDVVWQNGYGPFTAADVVFTFERLKDPERSREVGLVEGVIDEVVAVDDYTVEYHLAAPNADFIPGLMLNFRTGIILSEAAVEDVGEENYSHSPVGTGPYMVEERTIGERTVLVANPDYWGDPPQVQRFVFVEIPEETVRADALEAGEIDIASFRSPVTIGRLSGNPSLVTEITYDRPAIWIIAISDLSVPDKRVRQAIAYAINKEELAETVLEFRSNPKVVSYQGPGLAGFPSDRTEVLYPYNPEKAQELLAEAGVEPGELDLFYPTRADFQELSQAVAGYLEAIGINTELEVQEQALFRESIRSGGQNYDLTNFFPSRATANEMLAYYGADISTNQFEAGIPERVKELYALQSQEIDPNVRAELIGELMDIVEDEVPWVVIGYAASAATVHHPFIEGPFVNYISELSLPMGYITIDQESYREWLASR